MKDGNRIYNFSVMNANFKVSYHSLFGKYGFSETDVKKERKKLPGSGSLKIYSDEMRGVVFSKQI